MSPPLLGLAVALVVGVAVGAARADTCDRHDHRTVWLKDLYRGDELRVMPFGAHGLPCRSAWATLTRFFRDRRGHRRTVAPGLLRVLAQVQRHFGARQLHLMSGYRAPWTGGFFEPPVGPPACSAGACPASQARLPGQRSDSSANPELQPDAKLTSYHQVGHAADIWIDGIGNRDLFEYCRLLQRSGERLGCGLYPRGSHVHIDERSQATIWVDLSGYGDDAIYVSEPASWLDGHAEAGRRLE
jgi:uncharacterized protein YcbK (DUF882 family)